MTMHYGVWTSSVLEYQLIKTNIISISNLYYFVKYLKLIKIIPLY